MREAAQPCWACLQLVEQRMLAAAHHAVRGSSTQGQLLVHGAMLLPSGIELPICLCSAACRVHGQIWDLRLGWHRRCLGVQRMVEASARQREAEADAGADRASAAVLNSAELRGLAKRRRRAKQREVRCSVRVALLRCRAIWAQSSQPACHFLLARIQLEHLGQYP